MILSLITDTLSVHGESVTVFIMDEGVGDEQKMLYRNGSRVAEPSTNIEIGTGKMTESVFKRYHLIQKMKFAVILTVGILLLEVAGGILTNSLALLSDAGHIFADVFALGLSWMALVLSGLPPNQRKTYGYFRAEVLAAVINGVTLFLVALWIFYEAFGRISSPQPVKSLEMFLIALVGLGVNLIILLKLRGATQQSLNIKSAFLHVLGDMLSSVGVIVGGIIMLVTQFYIVDPIISILIGLIILRGATGVLRECSNILLEGVPKNIKLEEVEKVLKHIPGVVDMHDLHVWSISSVHLALSAHVVVEEQTTHSTQKILDEIQAKMMKNFNIEHLTIQFECLCCGPQKVECILSERRE
jgi:cobalt-zinc-cadmium efflux system protein